MKFFNHISILILMLFSLSLQAQQTDSWCGTKLSDAQLEWLHNFQQKQTNGTVDPAFLRASDSYIPMKVHILGNDDGNGYYKLEHLFETMCNLNEQFDSTGFHFFIDGEIDYIDNTSWYVHNFFSGSTMMTSNNVPNAMNVYFVEDPAGNCGYFSPGANGIAIAKSCATPNSTTAAHEIGHFFSLPHTFVGWESGTPPVSQQEKVDRSNCSTAADGFCDTPPDYAAYRWTCPTTGPFTDPNGESFVPDGTFYMSYSNDACTERFSGEQRQAMRANLDGPRSDLFTPTPPADLPLQMVEGTSPAYDAVNVAYNYTVLNWTADANAENYHIIIALNPSFTAIVQEAIVTDTFFIADELSTLRKFYWKVKPFSAANTCTDYSEIMKFTTGEVASGIEDAQGIISGISLWPNPAGSGTTATLKFEARQSSEGTVSVFSSEGRLHSVQTTSFVAGSNLLNLDLSGFAPGMYLILLNAEGQMVQQKMLISE